MAKKTDWQADARESERAGAAGAEGRQAGSGAQGHAGEGGYAGGAEAEGRPTDSGAQGCAGKDGCVGDACETDETAGSAAGQVAADTSVVWVGCKYAPVELLAGFGAQVRTLDADVASFEAADRLGGANLCGYGKALLTQALEPQVRCLVLTNCCDVTRRVFEIAQARGDFDFIWMIDLPHKSGEAQAARLRGELERMAQTFAQATGRVFDVGRACAAFEPHVPVVGPRVTLLGAHAPQALAEAATAGLPVPVENLTCSGARTLPTPPPQLARAPHEGTCTACMPQGAAEDDGTGVSRDAKAQATRGGADKQGSTSVQKPEGADELRGTGTQAAEVAGKPQGASERVAEGADTRATAPNPSPDTALERFLTWYAPVLLGQTPCMRMDDVSARAALTGRPGEAGVIYHTMKFCDYYGFEYASMCRDGSETMLKVETDGTSQSAGQLRTRIEAFGEALRARKGKGAGAATGDAGEKAGERKAESKDGHPGEAATASPTAGAPLPARPGRYVVGVDSGSTTTDAALVDMDGNLVAGVIIRTGAKAGAAAQNAIDQALAKAGATRDDVALYVSTGYGRDVIEGMDAAITEITCHARGAHYLAPETRTVIDIGGQDSKAIHLDEHGGVLNFVMNDKCAAGTGRFLEMMAHTLEMPLEELSRAGLSSTREVRISNMCSVFAESEVVSLIADDTPTADIVAGLCMSVANKTKSLARRVNAEPAYLMTGGVANNEGVVQALSQVLGAPVRTHKDSQLCGAIGAALLGLERLRG